MDCTRTKCASIIIFIVIGVRLLSFPLMASQKANDGNIWDELEDLGGGYDFSSLGVNRFCEDMTSDSKPEVSLRPEPKPCYVQIQNMDPEIQILKSTHPKWQDTSEESEYIDGESNDSSYCDDFKDSSNKKNRPVTRSSQKTPQKRQKRFAAVEEKPNRIQTMVFNKQPLSGENFPYPNIRSNENIGMSFLPEKQKVYPVDLSERERVQKILKSVVLKKSSNHYRLEYMVGATLGEYYHSNNIIGSFIAQFLTSEAYAEFFKVFQCALGRENMYIAPIIKKDHSSQFQQQFLEAFLQSGISDYTELVVKFKSMHTKILRKEINSFDGFSRDFEGILTYLDNYWVQDLTKSPFYQLVLAGLQVHDNSQNTPFLNNIYPEKSILNKINNNEAYHQPIRKKSENVKLKEQIRKFESREQQFVIENDSLKGQIWQFGLNEQHSSQQIAHLMVQLNQQQQVTAAQTKELNLLKLKEKKSQEENELLKSQIRQLQNVEKQHLDIIHNIHDLLPSKEDLQKMRIASQGMRTEELGKGLGGQ